MAVRHPDTPTAARPAASGWSRPFRYHGVWGIGVMMFRRMSFLSKATVISAIFLLVVAQFAFIYLRASGSVIDLARRERSGLVLVADVAKILEQAQALRRLMLVAPEPRGTALDAPLGLIDAHLVKLESQVKSQPVLAEATKFARDAYTPLRSPPADREEAFSRADEFVQQLLRLMASVADESSLSQDPEAASFHLMLAVTQEVPYLLRMLGRTSDLGFSALTRQEASALERRFLQGDSYVMYGHLELMFARFERVLKAQPDLQETLAFQDAFKPVNTYLRSLRKGPVSEKGMSADAGALSQSAGAAIESMNALLARSNEALATLIERRIRAEQNMRNLQLALGLSGVLVGAYFFHCFYLVTRGGLREVTRHIEAMAQGDLSTRPRPLGSDEAAALMISIVHMQDAMRTLIGQVRECASSIVQHSSDLSSGAQDLSARTEQAASSLQQTAASIEEIAASARLTATRVSESALLGQDNTKAASEAGGVITQVITAMNGIQASSRRINEIIGVVDGIAFQTNILALNAAVEAARAGEQGRGFAVVASEVRALAQRSATAARDVKNLVAESTAQAQAGTQVVNTAGDSMARLLGNAKTISELLSQVALASSEQTRGVSEVSQTIGRLDSDTQRNAALVEQTTAAAMTMQQRAAELVGTADRFKLPEVHP